MSIFKIDADEFEWINGEADDPEDRCLHGRVTVHIGDETLVDNGTVSATALYLLKTLSEDKLMSPHDIQMIPCCGHFLIADAAMENVGIIGCDYGTDWSTVHDGEMVRLILADGRETKVAFSDYRGEVLRFAKKIEDYYKSCLPKLMPEDEFTRSGYIAFWNEWHRRYAEAEKQERWGL